MMCYPTDFVALPNIHQIRRKVRKPHVPCISLAIYICIYTSYIIIHQSDIDSGHLPTSQWKNPESCGIPKKVQVFFLFSWGGRGPRPQQTSPRNPADFVFTSRLLQPKVFTRDFWRVGLGKREKSAGFKGKSRD